MILKWLVRGPALQDFIYPQNLYCCVCGEFLDSRVQLHGLCEKCISETDWTVKPLPKGMCNFTGFYSCASYGHVPRTMVEAFKFGGKTYIARPMARMMCEKILLEKDCDYDMVTFVPQSAEKRDVRGFNQSEILAKLIARTMFLPCKKLLVKNSEKGDIKKSGKTDRVLSVTGSFSLNKKAEGAEGKTILLVDDVLTTGSTANEASRVLLEAGAARVDLAVFTSAAVVY